MTIRLLTMIVAGCMLALGCASTQRDSSVSGAEPTYLTFGIFLGSVEEGARIFGPIRLLPFEHPDALNHEFPNPMRQHTAEVRIEEHLGSLLGLKLRMTLQRYPRVPSDAWPYEEFAPPPVDAVLSAPVTRLPLADAPLAGLRAVAVIDGKPLAFLLDTRGMTLAERGMTRPTSMGIDKTRAEVLAALEQAVGMAGGNGALIVVFTDEG